MPAILFGSLSTLSDTSELQREAFNEAFKQHGLDWNWGRDEYRDLLSGNGGAARIADYAEKRGDTVDADAVHATKSEILQRRLASGVQPRPGVAETIKQAKEKGTKVGFVTTTSKDNVFALFQGLEPEVKAVDFDLVTTTDDVSASKPDPEAYTVALRSLGEDASDAVAIEDNIGGVQSAREAGVRVVAFPNENTVGADFGTDTTDQLDYSALTGGADK